MAIVKFPQTGRRNRQPDDFSRKMIVWSLNNYLGLANHPEVRKVDAEAAAEFGLAYPMGARMMSGNSTYHERLEKELAEFEHKEDAILLNFRIPGHHECD